MNGTSVFNSIFAPGVNEWSPEKISGRDIDNTASRYSSWGGVVEVLDLEHHLGVVSHWDSLGVSKSKNLVIIEHSVQVLNPNGIDWTITNDPRDVLVLLVIALLPDLRENSWKPFTGNSVHNTVHLLTSDGLWIKSV
jgi:hypothetical protein